MGCNCWRRASSNFYCTYLDDVLLEGVIYARVGSVQAARNAVACLSFRTARGARPERDLRHTRYGRDDLAEFTNGAREHTLVVVMIENREGLDNVEEIAAVEGVDVLLEGAADLSRSSGLSWQTRHPDIRAAVSRIRAAGTQPRQNVLRATASARRFRVLVSGRSPHVHSWR